MLTHVPVLFSDVCELLRIGSNDTVIDATLGGGGHARGLLELTAPGGKLLGLEADKRTLQETSQELSTFGSRFIPVHGNFRDLKKYAAANDCIPADGILIDLGLSSIALADPSRGFSFQHNGPLDMRFDPSSQTVTAADIVNTWPQVELAQLFKEYGEERLAERIATHLVAKRATRELATTIELAEAVIEVKPRRGRIHPATQIFQALRIAVNDEFGAIRDVLPQALDILKPGQRLAVITFHSLEDRLVKHWSHTEAKAGRLELVNKHVITAGRAEQLSNPRSRSAKLRVIEKIPNPK